MMDDVMSWLTPESEFISDPMVGKKKSKQRLSQSN